MIREVLAKRGHNPDLVQLLPGFGDTGEALVKSKGIAKILFIGSPATGTPSHPFPLLCRSSFTKKKKGRE
jgi:acyl-CoA reductase-like NAD-dependent aldehyde dehydrogenase